MSRTNVNKPCPCGSGKKYKKCCEPREKNKALAVTMITHAHAAAGNYLQQAIQALIQTDQMTPEIHKGLSIAEYGFELLLKLIQADPAGQKELLGSIEMKGGEQNDKPSIITNPNNID